MSFKPYRTLKEISHNDHITQDLCNVLKTAPNYKKLTDKHIGAYQMIFYKIAKSACGNSMLSDNIHDIAMYANILEEYIIKENNTKLNLFKQCGDCTCCAICGGCVDPVCHGGCDGCIGCMCLKKEGAITC